MHFLPHRTHSQVPHNKPFEIQFLTLLFDLVTIVYYFQSKNIFGNPQTISLTLCLKKFDDVIM